MYTYIVYVCVYIYIYIHIHTYIDVIEEQSIATENYIYLISK
jgi:hypothetical protein